MPSCAHTLPHIASQPQTLGGSNKFCFQQVHRTLDSMRNWLRHALHQVGVGMSLPEQRSHFALWALLKAPLIIGADLRSIDEEALAILKAKELIAVNQDELGVAGDLLWKEGSLEVCFAQHQDRWAVKRWTMPTHGNPSDAVVTCLVRMVPQLQAQHCSCKQRPCS